MIRMLIVDDHRIFREGLARLLRDHEDFDVVAEAGNSAEAMSALRLNHVDFAILDLMMPGIDGIELTAKLKAAYPAVKVLIITMSSDDFSAGRALRAGADGYLTKENAIDDVVSAVRVISRGARYLCASVAESLALHMNAKPGERRAHERLSDREFKVFEMLVAGKRGAEIAHALSLSEKTVSTHKSHVLRKLNLQSGSDLVRYAIRHQLVAA